MLTVTRMGGAAQLRMLLADIRPGLWREILGVSDRTLRRYLNEETEIPQAVFQALYWHTRWGDSEIQSRYGYELHTLRSLVAAQRDQLHRLAVWPAANSGRWLPAQVVSLASARG